MRKVKNEDIAIAINKKYGKTYTPNYISTIFRQRIIPKINEAAAYHEKVVSNLFFEEEFKACSNHFHMMTDDGSYGRQGNVCVPLKELLEGGETFDEVITIGPLIMMKFVCATTKEFGVKTIASMNPIMIDGTGMCGGCRLTVGGEMKFACVDGPEFDGHLIDFDEAMSRSRTYAEFEAHKREEACNLFKKEVK